MSEKTRGERWAEDAIRCTDLRTTIVVDSTTKTVDVQVTRLRDWMSQWIDGACAEALAEHREAANEVRAIAADHAEAENFRRDLAAKLYVQLLTEFDECDALRKAFKEADYFIAELAKTKGTT